MFYVHMPPHDCRQIQSKATFHILHDHAEMPPGFKGTEHGHHKGVLSKGQDVSFHKDLLDLVPQHQVLPVDLLHGEPLTGLLVAHQKNSPVWWEKGGRRTQEEEEGKLQDRRGQESL